MVEGHNGGGEEGITDFGEARERGIVNQSAKRIPGLAPLSSSTASLEIAGPERISGEMERRAPNTARETRDRLIQKKEGSNG